MNCGKSTSLLQTAYNYEERDQKPLILKPKVDTKGGNKVVSRLGVERDVDLLFDKDTDLYEYIKEIHYLIDCVLVDEVQFANKNHIDQLFKVAVMLDIPVMCYGLRTDFQTKGFEGSTRLLELAHTIEELKTICRCGSKAVLNTRKVDGEFVFDGDQVVIDNNSKVEYESVCGKCYHELKDADEYKRYNYGRDE